MIDFTHILRNSDVPLFYIVKKHQEPERAAEVAARYDFAHDLSEGEAWNTLQEAQVEITEERFDEIVDEQTGHLKELGLKYGHKRQLRCLVDVKQNIRDERRLAGGVALTLQDDIWEAVRKYQGVWYVYQDNTWVAYDADEFDAQLYGIIKADVSRVARTRLTQTGKESAVPSVSQGLINSVKIALLERNKITRPVPGWMESSGEPGIAFENGILVGKELLPKTADYFSLTNLPHPLDYTNEPPSELLKMFQTSGLQEDEIEFLQEFLGVCLTSLMMYQRGLLLLGPARSGKGTFLKVLRWMVGRDNYVSKDLGSFGNQFSLGNLPGTTVCAFEDERQSKRSGIAGIKRLLKIIGGDPVDVEKKNVNSATTDLVCKIAIASNYIPELPDESGAIASRFAFVRTRVSHVGKEDRELFDRIIEQRDEVISWAVRGLLRVQEQGDFTLPDNGEELKFLAQNSPVRTFLDTHTVAGESVCKTALYQSYEKFSVGNDISPLAKNQFYKQVKDVNAELVTKKVSMDGERIPCIVGIQLKQEAENV